MSATIRQQTKLNGPAVVSAPLLRKRTDQKQLSATDESMSSVIAKLAGLRERYLTDLQAARNAVKKNFLR